jgi:hypothetical protein
MIPSSIGVSSLNGEDKLMTVKRERLIVEPTRNFDHLDGVQIALAPEAVSVDRLVG